MFGFSHQIYFSSPHALDSNLHALGHLGTKDMITWLNRCFADGKVMTYLSINF